MKTLNKLTIVLLLIVGVTACSDFLEPSIKQNKTVESIDGVRDLQTLIIGAHDRLSQLALYGGNYILFGDMRTANAFGADRIWSDVGIYNYFPTSDIILGPWSSAYEVIANCNLIINSDVGGSAQIEQIKGQAYTLRALAHMILLELYGQQNVEGSDLGIPYVTTFLGEGEAFPKRLTVQATYDKIGADFENAIQLMDPSVTEPSTMITYYGALALQARYFMKIEEYAKAAAAAKEVIDSGVYSLVPASDYLKAWGTDGEPAFIFGIAFSETDNIPIDGLYSIISQKGIGPLFQYGSVEITKELYDLFGTNDIRKQLYTVYDSNLPPKGRKKYRVTGKYENPNTNVPVIRYAEVVLTYAEAQFRRGNKNEARQYLNKIPNHRNASTYAAPVNINDILLERRKELAMEGRYFWTLMRTEQDVVRDLVRPVVSFQDITIPYGDHLLAFPIPDDEINANPSIQQNTGY